MLVGEHAMTHRCLFKALHIGRNHNYVKLYNAFIKVLTIILLLSLLMQVLISIASISLASTTKIKWRGGETPFDSKLAEFTFDVNGWNVVVVWYDEGLGAPDLVVKYCGLNMIYMFKDDPLQDRMRYIPYWEADKVVEKYANYNREKDLNYTDEQRYDIWKELNETISKSQYAKQLILYRLWYDHEPTVLEIVIRGGLFKEIRNNTELIDKGDEFRLTVLKELLNTLENFLRKYNIRVVYVYELAAPLAEMEKIVREALDSLERFLENALAEEELPEDSKYLFEKSKVWHTHHGGMNIGITFRGINAPPLLSESLIKLVKWLRDNWGYCDVPLSIVLHEKYISHARPLIESTEDQGTALQNSVHLATITVTVFLAVTILIHRRIRSGSFI